VATGRGEVGSLRVTVGRIRGQAEWPSDSAPGIPGHKLGGGDKSSGAAGVFGWKRLLCSILPTFQLAGSKQVYSDKRHPTPNAERVSPATSSQWSSQLKVAV
jgi:hypothetical protein